MQEGDDGCLAVRDVLLDDDSTVPVVIVSRYRLAERVASRYGCETYLVVDEEQSSAYNRYQIHVRSPDLTLSVTWVIYNPRSFHKGLTALHEFLEQNYPIGKTLGEILISAESVVMGGFYDTSIDQEKQDE